MKLSFSTNAFVRFSVPEAIEIIAETGYEGVEILADVPHLYPFSTTGPQLAEIAASLEKNRVCAANINANNAVGYYGAKFWEPLFEPSLANPEPEARKWRVEFTKKCIDMARFLSCRNVSVTSGKTVPGVRPEKSLALLKQSLLEIAEYAAAGGVRVGMEYEPGLLVERAEELDVLIREIGAENFGANLDLGHSRLAGESPVDVTKRLGSRIFHIHLEDIAGRKHYHLIPGEGDIDFQEIFRALAGIEYDGFVTVELYTFPENPEWAARRAFEYLDAALDRFRLP
jgi:sugar phosphate isomerase/epimerase